MDLTQTGWFNDPGMWQQMLKLDAVDQELLDHPTPFKPEIAVVVDEESMLRVAAKAEVVTRPAVYTVRKELGRMGAPYGQYLLDDVVDGKVKAKLYLFLNAWALNAEQRDKLTAATRGSVCVWCYAPGFVGQQQAITSFKLEPIINVKAIAKPLGDTLTHSFGSPFPLLPQFKVVDATVDETLATYPDGSVAVAMRKGKTGGAQLFSGVPGLTTELLRFAAKQAKAHLYSDTECNLWANGRFIAVHASQDGPLTIDTRYDGPVYDVMTGETLTQGPKLSLNLRRGETRVLRLGR